MLSFPKTSLSAGRAPADTAARFRVAATGLLAAAIVVAFLYFGRDVLIPLALTTLISFALGPVVSWLRRCVGLRVAVAVSVLLAVLVVCGIAFLLAWQIADLAANLPKYRSNLNEKIEALRSGGGLIAQAVGALRELGHELTRPQGVAGPQPAEPAPMPVRIQEATAIDVVASYLYPVILPLLMAALIIVLVTFMLLEREPLRDRLIRLVSRGDISRTTDAINDAVERLSRFLAAQVLINIGFGAVIAGGLWLIGMPNPLVWGLLGGVLRFVPYAGSLITAAVPTLVAFAVAPGWTLAALTFGLIVTCEIVVGQVVEPLRYGSSTGMSPLAVLVSTMGWVALWGPVGLLLAMPLTVCLIVIGRHVPQLAFLGVLLGDDPVLPAEAQIYHRLLARSPFDAVEIAVDIARRDGVLPLYDQVMLPVLVLAESDRKRAALDAQRQQLVLDGVEEIVAAVSDEPDTVTVRNDDDKDEAADTDDAAADARAPDHGAAAANVLCVGGRGELDRGAALLAADTLSRRGIAARACGLAELPGLTEPQSHEIRALLLCLVQPGSATVIGHLLRRVRGKCPPKLPIAIAAFSSESAAATSASAAGPGSTPVARTLGDLREVVAEILEHNPQQS